MKIHLSYLIFICTAFLFLSEPQRAQNASRPQFEVASIKRNVDGTRLSFGPAPGGRLIVVNNAPFNLIVNAYNVRLYQIVGAPSWFNTEHYDIEAKAEGNATLAQMMPMLQALLEDRLWPCKRVAGVKPCVRSQSPHSSAQC
jgi:hypothetical protein